MQGWHRKSSDGAAWTDVSSWNINERLREVSSSSSSSSPFHNTFASPELRRALRSWVPSRSAACGRGCRTTQGAHKPHTSSLFMLSNTSEWSFLTGWVTVARNTSSSWWMALNPFCSCTPTCNFSSTLYHQSSWCISQVVQTYTLLPK
jgi:hypothetical protein